MNWLSTRTDHLFTGRGQRWDKIRSRSRQLTTSSACGCARRRVARGTRGKKKKRAADWKMASGRVGQFPARHTHTRERPIKKKKRDVSSESKSGQRCGGGCGVHLLFSRLKNSSAWADTQKNEGKIKMLRHSVHILSAPSPPSSQFL